jgi:ABC-type lipoprotein release transport system permease subunit
VVLVSEGTAARYWPGQDAIGQRIKVNMWAPDAEVEVVGVVGDVRSTLDGEVGSMIYYPLTQVPPFSARLVVRGTTDPRDLATAARGVVRELDSDLPVGALATMESTMLHSVADRRFIMVLLSAFAGMALLLAAIGLYAVLSYVVGQRVREMGVRTAMGASRRDLVTLVLKQGMTPALIGIVVGVSLAGVLVSVLRSLLFGIEPHDPVTAVVVSALLGLVALAACYIPARRAAAVDPMEALRTE